ncbi:MAG TPA: PQQ-binding-like beta-propeller repeat protein [Planctomycetaceae bacterium]|nr:PQQ-binding-like beta-propeller repeat protein [Planctomycetaceae bacterium]
MKRLLLSPVVFALLVVPAFAGDWPQFRGENGAAISDDPAFPEKWDAENNLVWKAKLPAPGASSPIVWKDRVYITSYSGYGASAQDPGRPSDLVRHLTCVDRKQGQVLWTKDVRSQAPEANYQGFMQQHGYASNTPATDGKRLYVFLGSAGVFAFDLEGNEIWRQSVGTGTHNWGSASSVRLYDDLVIVNAAVESSAIVALKKNDGTEAWKFAVPQRTWSTPALVESGGGKHELVVSAEGRIFGLDPKTGKELWSCEGIPDYICPSAIPGKGVAYVTGGRRSMIVAVKAGGAGDVSASHVLWRAKVGANVPTPVLYQGHLFGVSDPGIAFCVDAQAGHVVYQERLKADEIAVRPAAFQQGRKRGRRGGGGFDGGLKLYASAVAADGKIFAVSRGHGVFVLAAKPALELLARNRLDSDNGPFDATPALASGQIFLRSNEYLYCIGKKN